MPGAYDQPKLPPGVTNPFGKYVKTYTNTRITNSPPTNSKNDVTSRNGTKNSGQRKY